MPSRQPMISVAAVACLLVIGPAARTASATEPVVAEHIPLIAEHLARGGATDVPGMTCAGTCDEIWSDEHGLDSTDHTVDVLLTELLAARAAGLKLLPLIREAGPIGLLAGTTAVLSWKIGTGIRTKILKLGLPDPPLPKASPAGGTLFFQPAGYTSSQNTTPLPADGWILRWWYGSSQWSAVNLSHGWGSGCAYLTSPPEDFRVLSGVSTLDWCERAPVAVESYWLKENELPAAAPIEDYNSQPFDKQTFNWADKPGSKEQLEARTRDALESGDYPMLDAWYAHLFDPVNYPDPTTTQREDHRCDLSEPSYKNRGGSLEPDPWVSREPAAFDVTERPSGAAGAPNPYLRYGTADWSGDFLDSWVGWGWRHVQAKHGWNEDDAAATRATLAAPTLTVEQNPTSMRYVGS